MSYQLDYETRPLRRRPGAGSVRRLGALVVGGFVWWGAAALVALSTFSCSTWVEGIGSCIAVAVIPTLAAAVAMRFVLRRHERTGC